MHGSANSIAHWSATVSYISRGGVSYYDAPLIDRFSDLTGSFVWTRVGYLVDPASSDMLVLKIKPCMYQYKPH